MSPRQIIDIWINCPDAATADRIGAELLRRRLIACANRFPEIRSQYVWQGELRDEPEVPLLLKTRAGLAVAVEEAVRGLHPYDVPPILRLAIDGVNRDYADWVFEVTRAEDGDDAAT